METEAGKTGVGVKRQREGRGIRKAGLLLWEWLALPLPTPAPKQPSEPGVVGQRSSNPSLGKKSVFLIQGFSEGLGLGWSLLF